MIAKRVWNAKAVKMHSTQLHNLNTQLRRRTAGRAGPRRHLVCGVDPLSSGRVFSRVPGLCFRDCSGGPKNLIPQNSKLSTIRVMIKRVSLMRVTFVLEYKSAARFVVVPTAPTPQPFSITTISRFGCLFVLKLPRLAPGKDFNTVSVVI